MAYRFAAALAALGFLTHSALAATVLYPDRTTFNVTVSNQSLETFNEAHILNDNFTGPAQNGTTNIGGFGGAVFNAGDIVPGISFTDQPHDTLNFRASQVNGSPILETTEAGSSIAANFAAAEGVTNFAMDVYQFNAPGPVTVSVFGASGLISSSQVSATSSTPGFFGITSTVPITSVVTTSSDILPGVDNVAFAAAPLTYLNSSAAFGAVSSGMTTETFNEARSLNDNITGPISHATSNVGGSGKTVFATGDIVPGVTINSQDGGGFNLRASSVGGSTILETTSGSDGLVVNFTGDGITAASLDVFNFNATGPVTVSIYGDNGIFLGTDTVIGNDSLPTFVGITSPGGEEIKQLVVSSSDILPGIDNVSFGTFVAVPEPATLTLLLAATPVLFAKRRKNSCNK